MFILWSRESFIVYYLVIITSLCWMTQHQNKQLLYTIYINTSMEKFKSCFFFWNFKKLFYINKKVIETLKYLWFKWKFWNVFIIWLQRKEKQVLGKKRMREHNNGLFHLKFSTYMQCLIFAVWNPSSSHMHSKTILLNILVVRNHLLMESDFPASFKGHWSEVNFKS